MQEVYNQLFCLGIFIITGILIGLLFDIFRILRKSFHTSDLITYLQDILFWILAGSMMLFSIFTFNHGEIRSYVFIGIIIGVVIYMLAISKLFVKSSVAIILFFKKIFLYPIHLIEKAMKWIIINPLLFIVKKVKEQMQPICKKVIVTNSRQQNFKKLHNFTKSNKKLTETNKN